jgi:glycosyltransferase involved in cell wall biosynthesis
MNAFTGGCHHSEGCESYLNECKACPQLPIEKRNEAERNLRIKKMALDGLPKSTAVVAPSLWLHNLAKNSAILGRFTHFHVPNGIDLEKSFYPENKAAARKLLGLGDKPTALFVADRLDSRWKGFSYLRQALKILREKMDFQAVAVGGQANDDGEFIYLGRCDGDKMRAAYNAADVFVIPSVEDNLPNTPIEAAACGVPAVGFSAGGVPEIIITGQTGLVVPKGDVPALAQAVLKLLQDPEMAKNMGAEARKRAETVYPLKKQALAYLDLYNNAITAER